MEEIARKLIELKKKADHDPMLQQILQVAQLPADLEYVKPGGKRGGYYRRKPYTRKSPSEHQAEHRLKFSLISTENYGETGTVPLPDGREITRAAALLGDKLKGTGSPKSKEQKEFERLSKILNTGRPEAQIIKTPWK